MAYIPFKYLVDFFTFLRRQEDIEVITYNDFVYGKKDDEKIWRKTRDPKKIYVVIQHDVDSQPQRTLDIVEVQNCLGLQSNIMIFNRRVDRGLLQTEQRLAYTEYLSNSQIQLLQRLERQSGFNIGYHCNAYEQAIFNLEQAKGIFEVDIQDLRQNFKLEYFSYHGGVRDGRKHSNELLGQADKELGVHWVHNGDSLKFAKRFSDGGLATANRKKGNLLQFVKKMKPGKKYQILIHPQYYGRELIDDESNPTYKNLSQFKWFQDILTFYQEQPAGDFWREHCQG